MNRTQKIISLIAMIGLIIWAASNIKIDFNPEKNIGIYKQALSDYQSEDYQNAYYLFGKIANASSLKPAALYRQGTCAYKISDYNSAIKKYSQSAKQSQNQELAVRAKYMLAQILFTSQEYSKSKKAFKSILKKYPQSDYAIAANYYLGLIETNKPNKSQYFKQYLKTTHDGRFSLSCAKELAKLEDTKSTNLLIAKAYFASQDYQTAQIYLSKTDVKDSWAYLVKNNAKLKNYPATNHFTQLGLKNYSKTTDENLLHEIIDIYIKTQPGKPLDYLSANFQNSKGYDYIAYKKCKELPKTVQSACYNTLYYKFPNGQFSAEALSQVFYSKIRDRNYKEAKKIGRAHLRKFINTNSAPMVMYWMGKISTGSESVSYYRSVLNKFPDEYYAYLANLKLGEVSKTNLEDHSLNTQPIVFPYIESAEFIKELVRVRDYELVNELYKDDLFIQSWQEYARGNYSNSARLGRDAMEKIEPKPEIEDPRWKLVYPIHYYEDIKKNALREGNNPVLMLALIKEESYFNSNAKSAVGASGLMQLMPTTAKEIAKKLSYDGEEEFISTPQINIKLGNAYYGELRRNLRGRNDLAILAYNGGAGAVTKWLSTLKFYDADDFVEQIPYDETKNYLKKVYKSYWNYKRIYR